MIHRCKEPSGFPLAALLYGAGSGPVAPYRRSRQLVKRGTLLIRPAHVLAKTLGGLPVGL